MIYVNLTSVYTLVCSLIVTIVYNVPVLFLFSRMRILLRLFVIFILKTNKISRFDTLGIIFMRLPQQEVLAFSIKWSPAPSLENKKDTCYICFH